MNRLSIIFSLLVIAVVAVFAYVDMRSSVTTENYVASPSFENEAEEHYLKLDSGTEGTIIAMDTLAATGGPKKRPSPTISTSTPPVLTSSTTIHLFKKNPPTIVQEIAEGGSSVDPDWELTSGAYLHRIDEKGTTVQGALPSRDPWTLLYKRTNPTDTDGGIHPQNIFRLRSTRVWLNYTQESVFRVSAHNMSDSTSRNQSNGLLHFNRYIDQNNLYYSGIRVDGYAVIKKKVGSVYYTLAYEKVIDGPRYVRNDKISLIPEDTPIRLRTMVRNIDAEKVLITLWMDIGDTGVMKKIAEATDDGRTYGGKAFTLPGAIGIRTDFADVTISSYTLTPL